MNLMDTKNDVIAQFAKRRIRGSTSETELDLVSESSPPDTAIDERRGFVESDEYEWASPMSLPGLIAFSMECRDPQLSSISSARPSTDELFDTEDGDASHWVQCPGSLACGSADVVCRDRLDQPRNELSDEDEYMMSAAKQLPGQIIQPTVNEDAENRRVGSHGLCADCLNHDSCDFPRPAGGVWQCEEYI